MQIVLTSKFHVDGAIVESVTDCDDIFDAHDLSIIAVRDTIAKYWTQVIEFEDDDRYITYMRTSDTPEWFFKHA